MERTRQQLDPVGSLANRLLAVLLSVGAFYYALGVTLHNTDQLSNPVLAAAALLCLAAACTTVMIGVKPTLAPFRRSTHVLVQLLVFGAIALSSASQVGANTRLNDEWGGVALGILMLAMGAYRPGIELAAAGSLAAIFIGFLTLVEVSALPFSAPPVAYVLLGITPILALAYAAAAYSGGVVRSLELWRRRMSQSGDAHAGELLSGITRSVQRDRLAILSGDVLPFYSDVLSRQNLTDEDRERARAISDSIRGIMVAEADRSWLELVIGQSPEQVAEEGPAVTDTRGLAAGMNLDQRAALRALIVAIRDEPTYIDQSLHIAFTGTGQASNAVLRAAMDTSDHDVRSSLSPYFAVMRVLFARLQVEFEHSTLTLKFSYEQR